MGNKLIISVIIPIYNAEKYIRRSVESVLCQMDGRIELILINDGSTDNTGVICDEYGMKNPLIRVVHKVNGGACSARNAGIAVATGEYIAFMDVDDYLEPNALSEIIKVIRVHRPDCIDFGWKYVNRFGDMTSNLHKLPKNILLGEEVLRDTIIPPLLHLCKNDDHFIYEFLWNKVYRRDVIESNSVFFDEGRRTWEDRLFIAQYLKYCRNYYSMNLCFYHYIYAEGSLSQQYSMDYFRIILASFREYLRLYGDEYDFDTQYVNNHWCHAIENVIFRSLEQTQNREDIKCNIIDTLHEEQVVYWYANRMPQDAFEKKVSALVVAGKAEEALRGYEKRLAQKRRHQTVSSVKNLIKRGLRKIMGR